MTSDELGLPAGLPDRFAPLALLPGLSTTGNTLAKRDSA
jgi:hypothetical protein